MKTVAVRNITLGEGIPKICVSIIGKTKAEIIAEAKALLKTKADIAEWRVDWYDSAMDTARVLQTARELRAALGNMPILFTFRTAKEGGEKEISVEAYESLNLAVIQSGYVDMVDVEVFMDEAMAKNSIAIAHEKGVKIVASNHDFDKTPEKSEIIRRLCYMQDLGADLPKIAVMPKSKTDVTMLLDATTEMYENHATGPIVTMSMSKNGVVSRISGEIFGSAMTFGAAKKVSAPGQLEVNKLAEVLAMVHELA